MLEAFVYLFVFPLLPTIRDNATMSKRSADIRAWIFCLSFFQRYTRSPGSHPLYTARARQTGCHKPPRRIRYTTILLSPFCRVFSKTLYAHPLPSKNKNQPISALGYYRTYHRQTGCHKPLRRIRYTTILLSLLCRLFSKTLPTPSKTKMSQSVCWATIVRLYQSLRPNDPIN